MNYSDALNMYWDKTTKCPDKKKTPKKIYKTDNTYELSCDGWSLVINKEDFTNIFDQLDVLYDNGDYTTYDDYVKIIKKEFIKMKELKDETKKVQGKLDELFKLRKENYDKDEPNKEKYQKLFIKEKKANGTNKYSKWLDYSFQYLQTQNKLSALLEHNKKMKKEINNSLDFYVGKKGTATESLTKKTGKKNT